MKGTLSPRMDEIQKLDFESCVSEFLSAEQDKQSCLWRQGDVAVSFAESFGADKKSAAALAGQVGFSARWIRELRKVSVTFPESQRIPELTWAHHRIASKTDDKQAWLEKALHGKVNSKGQWSVLSTRELQNLINTARGKGTEAEASVDVDEVEFLVTITYEEDSGKDHIIYFNVITNAENGGDWPFHGCLPDVIYQTFVSRLKAKETRR